MSYLVVGADDSNHAGDSKGEIIVVAFSSLKEDSIVNDFPNHRNYRKMAEWFENPHRDFRFTLLTTEKYRHSHQNLVSIVPGMIRHYLTENSLNLNHLGIYLDGRLDIGSREFMRSQFPGIEKVVIDNFIKKGKNRKGRTAKHPRCPAAVYFADVLANHLYSNLSFQELSKHEKIYSIQ